MARDVKDHLIGGSLTIPDDYYVASVDLDAEEPYCEITRKDDFSEDNKKRKKVLIPKSLAYYLTTHFCGSEIFRKQMIDGAKHKFICQVKELFMIGD